MQISKPLICGAILALSYIVPANAGGFIYPPKGGDGGGSSHSAPGPILGLGIPALAIAGGYVLFRRRSK
ncbi:MAG: LPXTG cell wall anchor domain-containing protein [Mesorhizobium sp.]